MKKFRSLFCLPIIAALALSVLCAFRGCDSGDDDEAAPPDILPSQVRDDPQSSSMTAVTADTIFQYSQDSQGVTIEKFKDAGALENYLNSGTFIIGTIDGKPVVKIADNAFNESEPGVASLPADLSVRLPETLREIGSGAFNISVTSNLLIPSAVITVLVQDDSYILFELDNLTGDKPPGIYFRKRFSSAASYSGSVSDYHRSYGRRYAYSKSEKRN
ncbi:MAG: leucine-rich repeat domain-containing protein [Spirochaetales bacterium]|jgi:hypothetical protein|nr:leucine-rich repeat domain-containing protein [Spirochaetales bacterium]